MRDLRAGIYRACGLLNRRTSLPVSPKTFFDSDKFDTDPLLGGAVAAAAAVLYAKNINFGSGRVGWARVLFS